MADKDQDTEILEELKRRAKEDIRYGEVTVLFKIHEGKITSGEIIKDKIKLG